ncbi:MULTISPECIES: hypothetical protein [unclassified Pseudomonas]|jgi:hypothetical protein|uniref:hypothetical protein n=1 Tax=unclassified Pseudomonas TaxID=196821 RepID=UPI002A36D7F0|nr:MULTISPECIES: hypothetical protein [unclassified Pseudomonas]MDX9673910.1 hypothetical protein [Pseudomonas sp. P8_250]WPN37567.1 hypothetical protein QMK53_07945 [Pseudomonas sp. P8_139]WPN40631.1 hypothetical protein QMK55_23430 [Pseudomonas sp. P8_229]
MARYIPITGIDCKIPCVLIDSEALIDVLHGTAAYRLRCVTQLMESLALDEGKGHDPLLLQDFARVLAIPLRDSCDLMDLIGWRLQAQL